MRNKDSGWVVVLFAVVVGFALGFIVGSMLSDRYWYNVIQERFRLEKETRELEEEADRLDKEREGLQEQSQARDARLYRIAHLRRKDRNP